LSRFGWLGLIAAVAALSSIRRTRVFARAGLDAIGNCAAAETIAR